MAAGVGTLKVGGYTGLVKWTAPGVLNFGRKVAHIPGRW
jgi:hypothetical protein